MGRVEFVRIINYGGKGINDCNRDGKVLDGVTLTIKDLDSIIPNISFGSEARGHTFQAIQSRLIYTILKPSK
ncbi:unnamed protein product, partial [marine sediment metagenome]